MMSKPIVSNQGLTVSDKPLYKPYYDNNNIGILTIELICNECNKSSSSNDPCGHLKKIAIKVKNEK